jgi:hypothetical protein
MPTDAVRSRATLSAPATGAKTSTVIPGLIFRMIILFLLVISVEYSRCAESALRRISRQYLLLRPGFLRILARSSAVLFNDVAAWLRAGPGSRDFSLN